MNSENLLPKRALIYVHDLGVRAIDYLAETFEPRPVEPETGEAGEPSGAAKLIEYWRSLSVEEKEDFVQRLVAAAVEVAALTAVAPMGLKVGKRAAKATAKVIRKKTRKLRRTAKKALGDAPPSRAGKKTKKA